MGVGRETLQFWGKRREVCFLSGLTRKCMPVPLGHVSRKNRLDNWGWQWLCERAPWDWGSILHSDFKISASVVHLGTADVCIKYQSCFPHSYCLTPVNLFFFLMGGRLCAHAAGCCSFSYVPLWITLGPLEELQEVPKIGNLMKVCAFNETCIGSCAFLSLEDSINEPFLFYGLCWLAG